MIDGWANCRTRLAEQSAAAVAMTAAGGENLEWEPGCLTVSALQGNCIEAPLEK